MHRPSFARVFFATTHHGTLRRFFIFYATIRPPRKGSNSRRRQLAWCASSANHAAPNTHPLHAAPCSSQASVGARGGWAGGRRLAADGAARPSDPPRPSSPCCPRRADAMRVVTEWEVAHGLPVFSARTGGTADDSSSIVGYVPVRNLIKEVVRETGAGHAWWWPAVAPLRMIVLFVASRLLCCRRSPIRPPPRNSISSPAPDGKNYPS